MDLFERERSKGKCFCGGPVDVAALFDGFSTRGKNTCEIAMRSKASWVLRYGSPDALQGLLVGSRLTCGKSLFCQLTRRREAWPRCREPFFARGHIVLGSTSGFLEHAPHPLLVFLDVLFGERAPGNEEFGVLGQWRGLLLDRFVHAGLSEAGLVGFVVAITTITDNVDDDVALVFCAVVGGKLAHEVDGLYVVAVDVENGCIDSFGKVGWVRGGTGKAGVGSETDLVVDDEMDGASRAVAGEVVEAHGFVYDTLTSKGGITVEQNAHSGAVCLFVTFEILNGISLSEHDGILRFKMGRIGDEGQRDLLSGWRGSYVVGTKVILDVTSGEVLLGRARELVENGLNGFSDDVSEDVETAAVRHADGHMLDTMIN